MINELHQDTSVKNWFWHCDSVSPTFWYFVPQKFEQIYQFYLTLLSKFKKSWDIFSNFLWPSHNIWTLRTSSNITSSEGNDELFSLWTFSPWFGNDICVQCFNSSLKTSKLHHSVWNLTSPQRNQRFVETIYALCCVNFWECSPKDRKFGQFFISFLLALHFAFKALRK